MRLTSPESMVLQLRLLSGQDKCHPNALEGCYLLDLLVSAAMW